MVEDYNRLIGTRVKMVRITKRMSQTVLAKKIGVTQTHLSNIENGRAGITVGNLIKLHEALECPISQFFEDIEHPHNGLFGSNDISLDSVMELAKLLKKAQG